mmetsp:Transcript_6320/g.10672  ORF Transcript_6320/g.10672 Transcript_6320/m.10672 type:complete len:238 (+) Transcript_6320:57-770(+)
MSVASSGDPRLFPAAAAAAGAYDDVRRTPRDVACAHNTKCKQPEVGDHRENSENCLVYDDVVLNDLKVTPGAGCLWCWQANTTGACKPAWHDLLPRPLADLFREKVDFLDVEGEKPVAAVSADWSTARTGGSLCSRAPLLFDPWNVDGSKVWSKAAKGTIVVARRGADDFGAVTRNAEAAGAVALVLVDDDDEWVGDWQMTLDACGKAPSIPAVLVPKFMEELLCSDRPLFASINRR